MRIEKVKNTFFSSNSFIIIDSESTCCWLVDVGDIEPILQIVGHRKVRGAFITHTHYDHIYGINKLIEIFPKCIIYTSLHGKEGLFSDKLNFSRYHGNPFLFKGEHIEILKDGDEVFLFPNVVLKAMYTPGHDWSCMSYYTDKAIFTGDSYIPNIKVITSFPKSNECEAKISYNRILEQTKRKNIYPGHGDCVYIE